MDAPAQASYRGSGACERVRRTGVERKGRRGERRASIEKCRGRGGGEGGGEQETNKCKLKKKTKKWVMTGGETLGLAGVHR